MWLPERVKLHVWLSLCFCGPAPGGPAAGRGQDASSEGRRGGLPVRAGCWAQVGSEVVPSPGGEAELEAQIRPPREGHLVSKDEKIHLESG